MDKQKMALIGQYLLEKDKKEWSEYVKELIKLNDMMYSDSDEDYRGRTRIPFFGLDMRMPSRSPSGSITCSLISIRPV